MNKRKIILLFSLALLILSICIIIYHNNKEVKDGLTPRTIESSKLIDSSTKSTELKESNSTDSSTKESSSESMYKTDEGEFVSKKVYETYKKNEKEEKEKLKFKDKLTNSDLDKKLRVSPNKIDWKNVNMSVEEFDEWLTICVTHYYDIIYTVNHNKKDKEIIISVIDTKSVTKDLENKLKPIIKNGLNHSEYNKDDIKIIFNTMDY